jgi:hypothetical protein
MNDLERAVVEAAQKVCDHATNLDEWVYPLRRAVVALDQHEQALEAAGVKEAPWAQVAEGDALQGTSGAFFPVVATRREYRLGKATGNFLITVKLPAGERTLIRPAPGGKDYGVVQRGAAGAAVDTFVHVFASGEAVI